MIVPGEGPLRPKIVIVSEAPGSNEERTGRPFTGPSGRLLDDMLIRCQILRTDCYITNVEKTRPLRNDFSTLYLDKGRKVPSATLEQHWEELRTEVKKRKPNIVIALGAESLRALTGKRLSIDKWRGTLIESDMGKILPTYHPAFILRMYNKRAIGELDLRKAFKESQFPELRQTPLEIITNPSIDQVMEFIHNIKDKFSFDIETIGPRVRCLGLGTRTQAISIPLIRLSPNIPTLGTKKISFAKLQSTEANSFWDKEDELRILKRLDQLFLDPLIGKIAQNFPFDATYLAREFGFEIKGLEMDTMIAQHVCYAELPKSLDFLTSMYTDIGYYGDYNPGSDLSTWRYNCLDCIATYQSYEKLLKELDDLKLGLFYKLHCERAMIHLTRAGNRGVLIDQSLRTKYANEVEKELEEVQTDLGKLIGEDLNPNSPKQMKELLYDKLGMTPIRHHKTKAITTNEEALMVLVGSNPKHKRLLLRILDHRQKTKLLSTFLRSKLDDQGRMQTSYNTTGTVTGRLSSSTTTLGFGGNLQQIPRGKIRKIYVAPKGKILLKADLAQAEARAVAWISNNRPLIDKFLDPEFDVHLMNASLIFSKPESDISKLERHQAKQCLHSANYRGGPNAAMKYAGVSYSVAKHALQTYINNNPPLVQWWQQVEEQINSTRRLTTPLGRTRLFFNRLNIETYRSATAFVPQSLIGDIVTRAFYKLSEDLPPECFPVLSVHDEIVLEVTKKDFLVAMDLLKEFLEFPINIKGVKEPLIIPCEVLTGKSWGDLKEIDQALCIDLHELFQ